MRPISSFLLTPWLADRRRSLASHQSAMPWRRTRTLTRPTTTTAARSRVPGLLVSSGPKSRRRRHGRRGYARQHATFPAPQRQLPLPPTPAPQPAVLSAPSDCTRVHMQRHVSVHQLGNRHKFTLLLSRNKQVSKQVGILWCTPKPAELA